MTALVGLIFDTRPTKAFSLAAVDRLEVRNHAIVLLSITPFKHTAMRPSISKASHSRQAKAYERDLTVLD
ncbi:MAG: hypothetical protein ABJF50_19020 [Paracoccaceae bacterium]